MSVYDAGLNTGSDLMWFFKVSGQFGSSIFKSDWPPSTFP